MNGHPASNQPESAAGFVDDAVSRIRAHLDRGAPWDACDVFREAQAARPGDAELLYWGALAHARAGAMRTAHAVLDRAEAALSDGSTRVADILSLRGRLWKDAFQRSPERGAASDLAERARDQYARAYRIGGDPYPGINAATLSMLLDDRATASRLAGELVARLDARQTALGTWERATLGEAQLLLGRFELASQHYAAAYRSAADSPGVVSAMRRQLALFVRVVPEADGILALLRAPDVVAFAGHMIDAPGRSSPRFPASLVPAVSEALNDHLARLHAPVIYTSAACGADLLLIDAALDRGIEVNIVLPFDRQDFVRTSVAVGGDAWVRRFDTALSRASRVVLATAEGYLGDDALFEHAALLVEGLAMLRAGQLQTMPTLLCVLDADDVARVGGTRQSVERWTRNVGQPAIIDLCALRGRSIPERTATPARGRETASQSTSATGSDDDASRARVAAERPRRTLKTMLFADFAGYSRLHDAFAPLFQQRFLEIGASLLDACAIRPLEAKTWGDAVYAVFESPRDGAEFALRFLERMLEVDWTAAGLSDTSQVRIALHAGPVFRGHDPIMHADSHFGSAVTRAARIEPVTPPGMVYASEAFAATLASTGQHEYALEYIGTLPLAKGYGDSRIYRLDRCQPP